jgi:hypothetical protein
VRFRKSHWSNVAINAFKILPVSWHVFFETHVAFVSHPRMANADVGAEEENVQQQVHVM